MPKISLDLTGKWEFKEYPLSARRMRDLDSASWQTATVPCSIFSSLIEAGQIKERDINANPEKFSPVSEKPWIYRKIFDVPAELLDCDRVELAFDGLDTIAHVWLNGKLIAKTNNMFIPFRFDVTGFLKPLSNSLLVKFEPAAQYAKKLMHRYTLFSESDFTNPHRVYIRKAQYQFGWDFCPALAGCGIWRPVRLEGTKKARLDCLHVRTVDCNQHYADVKITIKLHTISSQDYLCKLTLVGGNEKIEQNLTFNPGEDSQSTVIHIENPALWWPAGYGQQNLYQLTLQLLSSNEIIDQTQQKIGIRTVKLNRLPDKYGEKFQFEVNGLPIFARGANWVPVSIFAGSVTKDDYEKLLRAAAQANINMLRVWGGGYYETDLFYELCDELGIMVWQDFMFACAYYPDRQWFIKEVKNEAATIIKQLRNHPCLALWCGNNEIDWMHYTGKLGKRKKFYGKPIYHRLLPQLVAELDPDTDYIPTTPLGEKDNSRFCGNDNPCEGPRLAGTQSSGKTGQPLTTHQWSVWSGHQPIRHYQCHPEDVPRFVTEFGLQSLPGMETIKDFCPPDQLRIGTFSIEKHNYQLDGNSRLYRYVCDLFGTAENLQQLVYLSQITQARAAKIYVEHLRAHNFRNKGVLFWQFNDCCPAISWSAIDHNKEPKALYYYARRFFSNLLVTIVPEFDRAKASSPPVLKSLSAVIINDSDEPITATLNCRLIDLSGSVLDQVVLPVAIGPFSTSAPLKLPRTLVFPDQPDKSALHLLAEKHGKKITENLIFYLPDKYIDWPKPQITTRLSRVTNKLWKLKLKSNTIARDVQITATVPAQFSDNFVDLIPPQELEITVDCRRQVPSLESVLQLRWLRPAPTQSSPSVIHRMPNGRSP